MNKIIVWRGSHGSEILDLIKTTLNSPNQLLILCPPRIDDQSSFFPMLPSGTVEFKGELADRPSFENTSQVKYPEFPQFGLFSSGTTDAGAKLILYTKKNLETACEGIFSFFNKLDIKSVYSYPQPYHIFGLSLGYIAALKFNWELIVSDGPYSRIHHEKWMMASKEKGANLLTLGTPTHFLDAMTFIKDNGLKSYPSLTSIAGGAKVEVSLWSQMQEDLLIANPSVGYGCSEASPGVTHLPPGTRPSDDGDLGFILPNGKLEETSKGFFYEGPNICLGIIQNSSVYFPMGKFLLPDTLSLDEKGHYHFKKRTDLILNRGGEKFSLEEIEGEIKKSFKINSVAVAMKDARLGEELGLLYESSEDLKLSIQKRLADVFKRTFKEEYICSVELIPVNANAKFDRKKCLEILMERV